MSDEKNQMYRDRRQFVNILSMNVFEKQYQAGHQEKSYCQYTTVDSRCSSLLY